MDEQDAEWVDAIRCISNSYESARAWAENKANEEAQERAKRNVKKR